jgi:hypothetical protein
MIPQLEQGLGIFLLLVILLDVLLTVLYARIGTSIVGSASPGWSGPSSLKPLRFSAPGEGPFCPSAVR